MAVHSSGGVRTARDLATVSPAIARAAFAIGDGPLTDGALRTHIAPLFSRVLARNEIYLANHSLGRPLDQTADDLREFSDHWYASMDGAWGPWLAEIEAFRARAALLLGLDRADAVVPKSSAGHALRTAIGALPAPRPTIVATRGEFDSNDFILKVYAARGRADVRWVAPRHDGLFDEREIIRAIEDGPTPDLVCVSHVYYATGQHLAGAADIAAAARARGAHALIDCYHSAGVLPFAEALDGFDFAIGGSYKYIRGGPGPCFLAVHPRHLSGDTPLLPIDTGWFAKADTFGFERPDTPRFSPGGDAWLEATPIPAVAYQARAGMQLLLALGVRRLRDHNLRQQTELAARLSARGVTIRELPHRGAFLLLPHADASGLVTRLKSRGVNTDARLGHVRLCPDLLTTAEELTRAADIIAACV